jgi:dynein heavy chain
MSKLGSNVQVFIVNLVDFILKKPSRIESKEMKQVREGLFSPWHDSFLKAKEYLEENLYITNPILCEMIDMWYIYKNFKLIDNNVILEHNDSYRVSSFRSLILLQNEKCRNYLWNGWLSGVIRIFSRKLLKRRKFLGVPAKPSDGFFRAVQTLIHMQTHSVIQNALNDYISIFHLHPTSLRESQEMLVGLTAEQRSPRFNIRLEVDKVKREVVFDPPFGDLQEILLDSIRFITTTLEYVPDIQHAVYSSNASIIVEQEMVVEKKRNFTEDHPGFLQILNETKKKVVSLGIKEVENAQKFVKEYSQNCCQFAKEFLQIYDVYCELFNEDLDKTIDLYLLTNPTFEESIEVLVINHRKSRSIG